MEFLHINDVKKYFETAKNIDDLEQKIGDIPNKFGNFTIISVEQSDDSDELQYVTVRIANSYEDTNLGWQEEDFYIEIEQQPVYMVFAIGFGPFGESDFLLLESQERDKAIEFGKNIQDKLDIYNCLNHYEQTKLKNFTKFELLVETVYEVYNEQGECIETINVNTLYETHITEEK